MCEVKVVKKKWEELNNKEVVVISCIGDYTNFVNRSFVRCADMYNPKTKTLKTYKTFYIECLDRGECLQYGKYLIFKEGFEKEYLNYAKEYLSNISNKKDLDVNQLKNISDYEFVKFTINLSKKGFFDKEKLFNKLSKYFKSEAYVHSLVGLN